MNFVTSGMCALCTDNVYLHMGRETIINYLIKRIVKVPLIEVICFYFTAIFTVDVSMMSVCQTRTFLITHCTSSFEVASKGTNRRQMTCITIIGSNGIIVKAIKSIYVESRTTFTIVGELNLFSKLGEGQSRLLCN